MRLFQTTSAGEIKKGSVSFGYQIRYRKQPLGDPIYEYHKILVLHDRSKENVKNGYGKQFSLYAAYFKLFPDGHVERIVRNYSFFGYFENYYHVISKVSSLVNRYGNGSLKEWKRFYHTRWSKKVKRKLHGKMLDGNV